MNVITVLDTLAFLGFFFSLVLSARVSPGELQKTSRLFLMIALGIYVFVSLSNILEHTSVTAALDTYEDYAELLFLPLFFMFMYSVLVHREIETRARSEAAHITSESRFRMLVNTLPHGIAEVDVKGTITFANRAHERIHGYDKGELAGKSVMDVAVSDSEGDALRDYFRHLVREQPQPKPYVAKNRTKDGRIIDVQVDWDYIRDGEGNVNGFISVISDITERIKAEEGLRRAKNDLEKQNRELRKLDTIKDGLLRDVSHELKTPVAKHLMQLEILKPLVKSHNLTQEEENAILVMEGSIRRQQNVIHNLLNLARLESGGRHYSIEPLRLDELLLSVVEDYQYEIETFGIQMAVDLPPLTISSDREMLWHVFSNLLSNSIKFRLEDRSSKIEVWAVRCQKEAVVIFADNGSGIEPAERARIFTRFYQSSPANPGSGVGLTICKAILEGTGGKIEVESEGRGQGTTVLVTLPLS